jgi:hypothetical protein
MAALSTPFRDKPAPEIFDFVVTHGGRLALPGRGSKRAPDFPEIAELLVSERVDFGEPAIVARDLKCTPFLDLRCSRTRR